MRRLALLIGLNLCADFTGNAWAHTTTLKWTQSISPNLAYNTVYCSATSGGPYKLIYKSPNLITQTVNKKAKPGTHYCVVNVTNKSGKESKYSNEVKFVVP